MNTSCGQAPTRGSTPGRTPTHARRRLPQNHREQRNAGGARRFPPSTAGDAPRARGPTGDAGTDAAHGSSRGRPHTRRALRPMSQAQHNTLPETALCERESERSRAAEAGRWLCAGRKERGREAPGAPFPAQVPDGEVARRPARLRFVRSGARVATEGKSYNGVTQTQRHSVLEPDARTDGNLHRGSLRRSTAQDRVLGARRVAGDRLGGRRGAKLDLTPQKTLTGSTSGSSEKEPAYNGRDHLRQHRGAHRRPATATHASTRDRKPHATRRTPEPHGMHAAARGRTLASLLAPAGSVTGKAVGARGSPSLRFPNRVVVFNLPVPPPSQVLEDSG